MQQDLEERCRQLEEKIRILEAENEQLAERAEEILLLGLVAESVSHLQNREDILENVLERIALLKDIPYCACGSLVDDSGQVEVLNAYATFRENTFAGDQIFLSSFLLEELNHGACVVSDGQLEQRGISINLPAVDFAPHTVAIIPFAARGIPKGVLLFADDDRTEDRLSRKIVLLQRVVEMMVAELDNLSLVNELKQLNAELDRKVENRTIQLKRVNEELKLEIAERKRAEEEIRQNNEFLKNVLESLAHPFYVINADDLTISTANSAALMFGRVSEGDTTCYALTHKRNNPCAGAEHPCPFEIVKETKKPVVVRHTHYDKEGEARIFDVHGYPILDSAGHVAHMIEYSMDVTERVRSEKALRESEERYRMLFEQANDAIFLETEDDEIIDANRRACEMLGYTRDELLTMYVPDLQAPEVRGQKGSVIKRELEQYAGALFETMDMRRDGARIPVEVSTTRLTSGAGKHVLSIVRDITERKKAEEALRESEERLRQIIEQMPYPVEICRPDGTAVMVNQAFLEMFKVPSADLVVGKYNVFDDPMVMGVLGLGEEVRRVYRGETVIVPELVVPLADVPDEYGVQREGYVVQEITMFPVFRQSGEIWRVTTIWKDITEQVWAKEEIHRRNRELMLLNRAITTVTSTLEVEQVLQVVCHELARAFDLPQVAATLLNTERTELTVVAEYLGPGRPSALGTTIPVLSNPATQYVLQHQAPLVVTDAQMDGQMVAVHELMRERGTVSLLIVPVLVRGEVVGTIGLDAIERREFSEEEIALAKNVAAAAGQALETARLYQALQGHAEELEATVAQRTAELQVALEQARSADRVKSEFVSNVSHELRTPLTNLKLFLSLLTKGRSDKRQVYLDTMRRETDRLQELIENLLDLSRLDLGKTQANLQPTDVNLLVGGLAADRWALAADRGLTLDVELEEPTPLALADPKLIEQVVTNLFTNAVNYTSAGGTITLRTGLVEADDGRWATISVTDTGPGISEEEQAQLFERFFRGEAGRISDAPGTGLGLAIAKEIIDRHGGRITLESAVGQGSTFAIWLSLAGRDV